MHIFAYPTSDHLPEFIFKPAYNIQLPFACHQRLLKGSCHVRRLKNGFFHLEISAFDILLIGQIIAHQNTFFFQPAKQSVSADRDIFSPCKLCHGVHIDKIFGISYLICKLHKRLIVADSFVELVYENHLQFKQILVRLVEEVKIVCDKHIFVGDVAAGAPNRWNYLGSQPFTKRLRLRLITSNDNRIESAFVRAC